jgi:hypothetical protein
MNKIRFIIDRMVDDLCDMCGKSATCKYGVEYSEQDYGYLLECTNPYRKHKSKLIVSSEEEDDEIKEIRTYDSGENNQ